ncbi:hypothetical protein JXB27_01800, partial [Candidatus Woesearchaeota archaeon]|nr:hypothetical protein [Candidatus Woesearchaeota archaeon]
HKLRAKYYIRYVDDFVILHENKQLLEEYKDKIEKYLKNLKIELHPDKSSIVPIRNGVTFLGYRVFYHYKLLRKINVRKMQNDFEHIKNSYLHNSVRYDAVYDYLQGWMAYASNGDTYNLRRRISKEIEKQFPNEISETELNRIEKLL